MIIAMTGLLLAGVGCAHNNTVDPKDRPSHYAVRTNRLGSNIPQPYAAGADSNVNPDTNATLQQAQQLSNTNGSMGGTMMGGGGH